MDQDLLSTVAENKKLIKMIATKYNNKQIKRLSAPSSLNAKQQHLFNFLVNSDYFEPVFVSGSAGTGKSALLITLRNYWREQGKIVFVTAFTHLAARNIDGKTCHSLFGFDFDMNITDKRVGLPDYIIIDEISMIPEKMLDGIDLRMRQNSRNFELPFGGVNVVAFGDLYQLPPVNNRINYTLPPYESDVWNLFKLYELTENMRHTEPEYIKNLNLLRVGDLRCLNYFDSLVSNRIPTVEEKVAFTSLVSTHKEADNINLQCYSYIADREQEIVHTCETKLLPWSHKITVYNADQERLIFKPNIKICPNTRIMVTHTTQHFCNGDMGVIEYITELGLYIRREHDNSLQLLTPIQLYFNTKSKGVVKLVNGLPISYGWAITVHKAQGMTVKNLTVYPACLFAPGQAYVALSRSTHSDGLNLVSAIPEKAISNMNFITKVYGAMEKFNV
ncbi:helicase-2 [Pieris rapae granulovirus Wuhan]|uniref:Helicase-2 n=1 Tax=Pieris rapae granulovirus Wuhan TaxID=2848030 RepID=D2J4S5_9BBAC|nr:helicase-2 [Betabaculovirus arrapae]ACZ63594.1 helicase-2 [Betabaculovirus arrapae]